MLADKVRAATAAALPEFVSSSTAYSPDGAPVVTAPTGMQEGDLIVAVVTMIDGNNYVTAVPSGFVVGANYPGEVTSLYIATKVATASEPSTYTFTTENAGDRVYAVVFVFRNATRINTIGSPQFTTNNEVTQTAPSITPSLGGVLIAAFAWERGASTLVTAPTGMTQIDFASATQNSVGVFYIENDSTSATSSYTATLSDSGVGYGIQFQITNEPPNAPEFVSSSSTQNISNGSTLTISKPFGTFEGDLMVAVMAASSNKGAWPDVTGWTEVADQVNVSPTLRIAYKVAGSSEGSSYTFTNSTNQMSLAGTILTYRYATYDTIGTFATSDIKLDLPSINVATSQSILIAAAARAGASATLGTPAGMTALVIDDDGDAPSRIICDQIAPAGATGTRRVFTNSTSGVAGILLSLGRTASYPVPEGPMFIGASTVVDAFFSTTISLNIHPSTQDGDLMIAFIYQDAESSYTVPSGWTEWVDANLNDGGTCLIAYRTASSEGSTTGNFVASVSGNTTGFVATYRGAAIDVAGTVSDGTTASSITVTESNSKVIYFAGDDNADLVKSDGFGGNLRMLYPQGFNSIAMIDIDHGAGATGPVTGVNDTGTAKDKCVLVSIKSV